MADAAAPAHSASDSTTADLGVLLVHGIGEQAQGDTLTKFAEPIIDYMHDALLRASEAGTRVTLTPVQAALRAPLLEPGRPAHARHRPG